MVVADDIQMGDFGENRERLKGNGLRMGHKEICDSEIGIPNPNKKERKKRKKNPLTLHWTIQKKIKEMKDADFDSGVVAKELGLTLDQVNKYWTE